MEPDKEQDDMPKGVHELKLHERTTQGALEVLRVPGGWIYSWAWGHERLEGAQLVFVPYSNDLNPDMWKEPGDIIPGAD